MEEKKSDEKPISSPNKSISERLKDISDRLKDAVESVRRKDKNASGDQRHAEDFLNRRR